MTHMDFSHPYFGAFFMFVLTFGAFIAAVQIARIISRKLARLKHRKT